MAREAGSLCYRPVCSGVFTLEKSDSLLFISRHSALGLCAVGIERWLLRHTFLLVWFGVDVCGVEGLYKGEEEGSES